MRILMRNTVFKTVALTGFFACMLALGGIFPGITPSVHAMHGFIHAEEVGTDTANLQEFVEAAVDEYYIEFLIKGEEEHCDLTGLDLPPPALQVLPTFLMPYGISDLTPSSMRMLTTDQIKELIALFNGPQVQALLGPDGLDIWAACDFPPASSYREVFAGSEEENWRLGSIYLFVIDDEAEMLFNGADSSIEGMVLVAEDEGGRDVPGLIVAEAQSPMNSGIVEYCWDDPDVDDDEIVDSNGNPIPGKAPGDSLKISYVVDPFEYLGINQPEGSPGIIFGSGIYPKMDNRLPECNGNGIAGDMGGMDDMDDMDDMGDGEGRMTAVSGGGCAIVAGSDNAPRGTMFNLLLIVSALFFTISFRRRAIDRQNGVRS